MAAKFWLVLPSNNPLYSTGRPFGFVYAGTPGVPMRVPANHGDVLVANGWTKIRDTGPTSDRPTGDAVALRGCRFFDETLGAEIIHDDAIWRTLDGTAV